MSWMLSSIAAISIATCGPLLMVESLRAVRHSPALRAERRRLRRATGAVLLAGGIWFVADQAAIAAGARSVPVAAAAAVMFTALFLGLAHPLLRHAAGAPGAQGTPVRPRLALFRAPLDVPALLLLGVAAAGVLASPNDFGYRAKGAAILAAGVTAYFLGRPRASRTLLVCLLAGVFTLLADWQDPWQRAIGILAQMSVGVVGFAFCAEMLYESARRA